MSPLRKDETSCRSLNSKYLPLNRDYGSWSHPLSKIFNIGYYLNSIRVIQQFLNSIFGISFERSLETLPSDDSFSRDEIAIMVAGLYQTEQMDTHTSSLYFSRQTPVEYAKLIREALL